MFHILKRGESPEHLSVRYGMPICMIIRANPDKRFSAGCRITIPEKAFCSPIHRYTIVSGDTLYRIAEKHSTSMYALLKQNPSLDPQNLREGTVIILPPPSRIYTCRATDTIRSVAEQFGISEESLRRENLLSDGLYNGMQLILPESAD